MKAFKSVKDRCFGLERQDGWRESIAEFRTAWAGAGLSWSLKAHIISDHIEEYLNNYEPVPNAGLGLSSEQSGEAMHARLQRVWNLRFKVNPDRDIFPQRLIDCMVAYNWSLEWDSAERRDVTVEASHSSPSCPTQAPEDEDDRASADTWSSDGISSDDEEAASSGMSDSS